MVSDTITHMTLNTIMGVINARDGCQGTWILNKHTIAPGHFLFIFVFYLLIIFLMYIDLNAIKPSLDASKLSF